MRPNWRSGDAYLRMHQTAREWVVRQTERERERVGGQTVRGWLVRQTVRERLVRQTVREWVVRQTESGWSGRQLESGWSDSQKVGGQAASQRVGGQTVREWVVIGGRTIVVCACVYDGVDAALGLSLDISWEGGRRWDGMVCVCE